MSYSQLRDIQTLLNTIIELLKNKSESSTTKCPREWAICVNDDNYIEEALPWDEYEKKKSAKYSPVGFSYDEFIKVREVLK